MDQTLESESKTFYTCPRCQKELEVNLANFYYGKGVPFLFSCKTCYKLYRKELREKSKFKPSLEAQARTLLSQVIDFVKDLEISSDEGGPLAEEFHKRGFEYLGEGIDRIAYLAPNNLVVKVQMNGTEWGQNKTEIDNFHKLPERAKKLFIPLLAWSDDSKFIIVPKAETNDHHDKKSDGVDFWGLAKNLREKLNRTGLHIGDLHDGNVGLIEGKEVIIDYGFKLGGIEDV